MRVVNDPEFFFHNVLLYLLWCLDLSMRKEGMQLRLLKETRYDVK